MFRHPKENMYFKPPTGIGRGRKVGGIKRSSGIDMSKYKKGEVFEATSEYKVEVVEDPNGTGFMKGEDGEYIRDENGNIKKFSEQRIYVENKRGYLAIKKADEGSVVVVHYPEYTFYRYGETEKMKAHDEYYVIERLVHPDQVTRFLFLEYKGSNLPNNESIQGYGTHHSQRTDKTKNIKKFLGMSDKITIFAPKIKPKSYEEQRREMRKKFEQRQKEYWDSVREKRLRGEL